MDASSPEISKTIEACRELQGMVNTMSELLGFEVFVINRDLLCIAGTGPYESTVGCLSPEDTVIGRALKRGKPIIVDDPGTNEACKLCDMKQDCRDKANYASPVRVNGRVVAVSQFVAFEDEHREAVLGKGPQAVELLRQYITQLIKDDEGLLETVATLAPEAERYSGLEGLVGESSAMRKLKDEIIKSAPMPSTVLIQGESGVGKELAARAIHDLSLRSAGPFVAVNCGALPESIIESELFGYESGAFTGGQRGGKPGIFEYADGGSLFLDEVSELPLPMQVKLLRVLQERKARRLGGRKEREFDVRIIAASNESLAAKVSKGVFRQDLYYRLNVIPLFIPPLRDRQGDVELLVNHFVRLYSRQQGSPTRRVDAALMQKFRRYHWPGNVRELKNFIEYGVTFAEGGSLSWEILASRFEAKAAELRFRPEAAPFTAPQEDAGAESLAGAQEDAEAKRIAQALERFGADLGGKKQAAEHLGVSLATLYRKLKKYRLRDGYKYDVQR